MEPNQRVSPPYGDVFFVQTPALDRFSQQLYAEQKQRELLHQQRQRQLDDEFAKNMAGIRDADVPELTKLYGDWKLANQAAMKKRDGITPQEQLEILRKKGEMYKKIAESKAGLREEEDLREGIQKNPLQYDDNASVYLTNRRRLPLSQLDTYKDEKGNPLNLRDYNTYRYKGTDTDFQKILSTAAGTPRQVFQKEEPVGKDNLQFKITPYLYGNTPAQFKESVLSSLSQHKAGRDAEAMMSQIDPAVIDQIDKQYRAIPLETWKQMGVDKPQELLLKNADSKAERFANHQAQLYALNNLPKEGTPVFRDNKSAIDARDFAQQKALKNYEHALKIGDEEAAGKWVGQYLTSKEDFVKQNKPQNYVEVGSGWEMPMDVNLRKAFTVKVGGKDVEPDKLVLREDGKYVPVYYQYKDNKIEHKDNGFPVVDYTLTVPHTQDDVKVAMGVKTGQKQMNIEMGGGTTSKRTVESSTISTPVKKTIKASEIPAKAAAAGYTEKEYRALLKQNGIKIE